MENQRKCPECGAEISGDAPMGFCQACLLKVAMGGDEPTSPDATTQSVFASPAAHSGSATESALPPAGAAVQYFGDYILLQEIARGGMGIVYKARQQSLNRLVALKMILSGRLAGEAEVRRFRVEAEAAANLAHPNIVPIFEIGEYDGRHYFSMELIEGPSLSSEISKYSLDLRSAVELVGRVARAVHHAHQRGILHRDLKPSNILLDPQGQPHVTDFGLARRTEGDGNLTHTGTIMGTPNYMAPEQALGQSRQMTSGVDVWSIGIILYQLTTGQLPFHAESVPEILRKVVEDEPKRPSSINHHIDKDLEAISLRCLEKDKERRFVSAAAISEDLDRWLRGEPVITRLCPWWEVAMKWARRKPAIAALSAAVALTFLFGLAGVVQQWLKTEAARQLAEAKEIEARCTLSESDFLQATRLMGEGKGADALAYLARSVTLNGTNAATLTRLRTFLESRAWPIPYLVIEHGEGVNSAQFSPDGKRIVTASGETAHVLDTQNGTTLVEMAGHSRMVTCAQFSPDGKRIVTACLDSTVRIWDARSGKPLIKPISVGNAVTSAEFSPDGKRIIAAINYGYAVRMWDAQTGEPLTELLDRFGRISAAQFSPDGRRIVIASTNTAQVWDAQNDRPVVELEQSSFARSLQFSTDGKRIVAARADTASVYDAESGRTLAGPLKHSGFVYSARFSPDGNWVVTASDDGTARVWNASTGQAQTEGIKHSGAVYSAQFCPYDNRILTASADGTAKLWRPGNKLPLTERLAHPCGVFFAHFSRDGMRVVTSSGDMLLVWGMQTGQVPLRLLKQTGGFLNAQFSPNGKRIVTVEDGSAQVWDTESGQPLTGPLKGHYMRSVQFSPDGSLIVTASSPPCVWDARSGLLLRELPGHTEVVTLAGFSPDGRQIVTASDDGTARVWDTLGGQLLYGPLRHSDKASRYGEHGSVRSVEFSSDGRRIVTASSDSTAQVWDAKSGQPLAGPLRHAGPVLCARFSPDGRRIATASSDNTACVWDAESGRMLAAPLKHLGLVFSTQFSPDGNRIVTACFDGTARVWDAETGQPLTDYLKSKHPVFSAEFSPDGQRILTASEDGAAHIWDIGPSPEPCPDWLLTLAEVVSGHTLGRQGVLEPTRLNRPEALNSLRKRLESAPASAWVNWGRWFLADPGARTISPLSRTTLAEYINRCIQENTHESLESAVKLAHSYKAELLERAVQARNKLAGKER